MEKTMEKMKYQAPMLLAQGKVALLTKHTEPLMKCTVGPDQGFGLPIPQSDREQDDSTCVPLN